MQKFRRILAVLLCPVLLLSLFAGLTLLTSASAPDRGGDNELPIAPVSPNSDDNEFPISPVTPTGGDNELPIIPINPHTHTWDEGAVTTEPTCTESGVMTYHCTTCSTGVKTEPIDPLGHNYAAVVTAPTCTAGGFTTYTCTRCSDSYTADETEALGHNWGEGVVEPAPTCTQDGVRTYTCSRCSTTRTEAVSALGHTPGEAVEENRVEPSCTATGGYDTVVYCTVCRAELSREHTNLPAPGHTAGEATEENRVEPTCTTAGSYDTVTRCTVCEAELTRAHTEIPALGHTEGVPAEENRVEPTCTAAGSYDLVTRCTACSTILATEHQTLDALGHNFDAWTQTLAATCIAKGAEKRECTRCDAFETRELDALGHTAGDPVEENRENPTCTAIGGYDTAVYCTVCEAELSREHTELGALGHNWNEGEQIEASGCTSEGVMRYTCLRCSITKTEAISANGHTAGEPVQENRTEPSCTAVGGYDTVVYCAVCKAELSREHTELPANGHTAGEPAEENRVEPSCTGVGGYDTVVRCTVCQAILSTEHTELGAQGHNYVAAVTAPSCTAGGYTTYTCSRCSDSYTADETDAQGHNWGEGVVDPAPTCTQAGVRTYTCSRCSNTRTETIAANGHTAGEPAEENRVEPSCTAVGGYDTVVRCTVCSEILSTEHTELAAPGHTAGEPAEENRVEPTCTTAGSYDTVTRCTVCSAILSSEHTELAALGHTAAEAVEENRVEPSCTAAGGYDTVVYCAVCKAEISREHNELAALGHNYGEWAVATAPSCTAKGEEKRECSRCDAFETRELEMTEHQYENGVCVVCGAADPDYKPPVIENPFEDVAEGQFYYDPVLWAVSQGITTGKTATTFAPNEGCTRGQVVTFLWRAAGKPSASDRVILSEVEGSQASSSRAPRNDKGAANPFTDVKAGDYYYEAVLWAVANGITNGMGATRFAPNRTCTRGQIVTFLWRYAGKPLLETDGGPAPNPFTDVKAGEYYYDAVLWAVFEDITKGMSASSFAPNRTCTRGQVVTFLYRAAD